MIAPPAGTPGQDAGAIAGNRQVSGITEQSLSGGGFRPHFGKDLLHETLWTIFKGPALGGKISQFLNDAWSLYGLILVLAYFVRRFATKGMERMLKFMLQSRIGTPDTVDQVIIRTNRMDFVPVSITCHGPENGCGRKTGRRAG